MVDMVIIGAIAGIAAIILVVFFSQGKGKSVLRKVTRHQTPEMARYRDILSTAEKIAYEKQYSKATQFVYKSFAELKLVPRNASFVSFVAGLCKTNPSLLDSSSSIL